MNFHFNYDEPNMLNNLGSLLIENKTQQHVASINRVAGLPLPSPFATKPKKGLKALPDDFAPTNYSVILGRGKGSYNYVGNKRCRIIVKSYLSEYNKLETRLDRSVVVAKVINIIKEACPLGGFIKNEGGIWYEVSDKIAREKIFTMFRDVQNAESRGAIRAASASPIMMTAAATAAKTALVNKPVSVPAAKRESLHMSDPFQPLALNDDDISLDESLAESLGSFFDVDSCSLYTI